MICFPNAKINLGLHVVEKRPDGFHNIETIFYPIGLKDALEIIPSQGEGVTFTTSGLPIPGEQAENLILKACDLIFPGARPRHDAVSGLIRHPASGIRHPACCIHLHKVIPMGAGLGGGSSDAAFALNLLNELYVLNLSVLQLQNLAGQLGSDCAFFIENKPVFASGRGDQFEPVQLDLSACRIEVKVLPIHVSTEEAYQLITPRKPDLSLKEIVNLPVAAWKDVMVNDFEEPVIRKHPAIREAKEEMYHQGALYASMTGSGSAVFGLFRKPPELSPNLFPPDTTIFHI